jgi:hypothetical protein
MPYLSAFVNILPLKLVSSIFTCNTVYFSVALATEEKKHIKRRKNSERTTTSRNHSGEAAGGLPYPLPGRGVPPQTFPFFQEPPQAAQERHLRSYRIQNRPTKVIDE